MSSALSHAPMLPLGEVQRIRRRLIHGRSWNILYDLVASSYPAVVTHPLAEVTGRRDKSCVGGKNLLLPGQLHR
jgi:hypothetical protein